MGHLCCKQREYYVRQQDLDRSCPEAPRGGDSTFTRDTVSSRRYGSAARNVEESERRGTESQHGSDSEWPEPSEDSTKNSETALDGGTELERGFFKRPFQLEEGIEHYYGRTAAKGQSGRLSRRLQRFRNWRRNVLQGRKGPEFRDVHRGDSLQQQDQQRSDGQKKTDARLSGTARSPSSSTQWLMSPATVYTAGHQMFKQEQKSCHSDDLQQKEKKEMKKAKQASKGVEREATHPSGKSSDPTQHEAASPSHVSSSHRSRYFEEDHPYAVQYAPVNDHFPPPPSRTGSPRKAVQEQQYREKQIIESPKPSPVRRVPRQQPQQQRRRFFLSLLHRRLDGVTGREVNHSHEASEQKQQPQEGNWSSCDENVTSSGRDQFDRQRLSRVDVPAGVDGPYQHFDRALPQGLGIPTTGNPMPTTRNPTYHPFPFDEDDARSHPDASPSVHHVSRVRESTKQSNHVSVQPNQHSTPVSVLMTPTECPSLSVEVKEATGDVGSAARPAQAEEENEH